MRYFSTFSGIGGFEIGIRNAALSVRYGATKDPESDTPKQSMESTTESVWDSRDITDIELRGNAGPVSCVGYSEIDKYASSVYEYHFKGTKNYGDITKINEKELPDFDCLVGGFPCQAFSIAGKRRGFEDTRGTLFFDLARILRAKQPRYFVFENVKGLLSHDQGNTFRTIITAIDEIGYDCQWDVLNSKNFGVPQNRERIIIVGHLRGTPRPEVFPIGSSSEEHTTQANLKGIASTLTVRGAGGQNRRGNYITKQPFNEQAGSIANAYYADRGEPYPEIRRLTPVECERLQGFPDDWTAISTNGLVSDTQRYKMCGNAVTTNVIQAVFERLLHDRSKNV